MDQKMRKRIERVEEQVGVNAQRVRVIVWLYDELTADEKIKRWKNGEDVDGIDGKYQGGELDVIEVRFRRSPNSRANGVKDPNHP
jgi:hypothetical protein